jgi:8-oxo-dGTP pyrophosphatase MutT (NUDIX family)
VSNQRQKDLSPLTFPDDPAPWQVLSSTYLHRHDWMTVRQDHVRLPSGMEIREYFVTEFRPWVNTIAVTPDDRMVLVRQYRHGLGTVHYELPAGTTDPGEEGTIEAAAKRELLEETGYGKGQWRLQTIVSANPALNDNLTYTFVAQDVELVQPPAPEASEDLRVHLVRVAELAGLLQKGAFIQSLHISALWQYLYERLAQERRPQER